MQKSMYEWMQVINEESVTVNQPFVRDKVKMSLYVF